MLKYIIMTKAEILQKLIEGGIDEAKAKRVISNSFVAPETTFNDFEIVPKSGTIPSYVNMIGTGGTRVSLGNLLSFVYRGKADKAKFEKVERENSPMKGKFILKGTEPVNPQLSGDMATIIDSLMGKTYTSKVDGGLILPYKETGYTESEATSGALVHKKCYAIEEKFEPVI